MKTTHRYPSTVMAPLLPARLSCMKQNEQKYARKYKEAEKRQAEKQRSGKVEKLNNKEGEEEEERQPSRK